MIHGTPLVKRQSDTTDLIGIRTLVLSQIWMPSSSTLTQDQIDAEEPDVPSVSGGLLLVGEQTVPFGGCYKTLWTFEGVNGNGKDVTFKDRAHTLDYAFDPGFSQMEIQKHPFFQDMLTQYGGFPDPESGRVIWPQMMPNQGTAIAPGMLGYSSAASGAVNPMFDFQDYFSLEGSYRCRYAALSLPTSLYTGIGTIFATDKLPGGPPTNLPADPDGTIRNWLKLPPPYKRRGVIFDITEIYWLSGRGGWPTPIYSQTFPT